MKKRSRSVYVPSGVSSFFEISDRNTNGTQIEDPLRKGARGGGFIIEKGTTTVAESPSGLAMDEVLINGILSAEARTSLATIRLIRREFEISPVRVSHSIAPPIGQGFGTSGAGALATSIALSDLFELNLSLSEAARFAHVAEIESVTGLGTVISLASGTGAVGLVTEPGGFSVGRTDAILVDSEDYTLVCAAFGPIQKSSVLSNEESRRRVNEFGHEALLKIQKDPTPARLLSESRIFSEKTGLASTALLGLCDKAVQFGAVGAAPNMIGNAIHCLVERARHGEFMQQFSVLVPRESLFESPLIQSGPRISS